MARAVGICVGAVTLSAAEWIDGQVRFDRIPHDGKVALALEDFLQERPEARVGVTGQKYRKTVPYPTIAEPRAVAGDRGEPQQGEEPQPQQQLDDFAFLEHG